MAAPAPSLPEERAALNDFLVEVREQSTRTRIGANVRYLDTDEKIDAAVAAARADLRDRGRPESPYDSYDFSWRRASDIAFRWLPPLYELMAPPETLDPVVRARFKRVIDALPALQSGVSLPAREIIRGKDMRLPDVRYPVAGQDEVQKTETFAGRRDWSIHAPTEVFARANFGLQFGAKSIYPVKWRYLRCAIVVVPSDLGIDGFSVALSDEGFPRGWREGGAGAHITYSEPITQYVAIMCLTPDADDKRPVPPFPAGDGSPTVYGGNVTQRIPLRYADFNGIRTRPRVAMASEPDGVAVFGNRFTNENDGDRRGEAYAGTQVAVCKRERPKMSVYLVCVNVTQDEPLRRAGFSAVAPAVIRARYRALSKAETDRAVKRELARDQAEEAGREPDASAPQRPRV